MNCVFGVVFIFSFFMKYIQMINVICWNCRGLSNLVTRNCIKDLLNKHKPQILCLVETRANEDRVLRFCNRMSKCWD